MSRGRPSLKLDKQRLHNLREEKGLTLLEFSSAISNHHTNWGRGSSNATLTANYQRIEREGTTSRKTADAIAKVLDVSLEFLQGIEGPDSADYLKQITKLISEQIAEGSNDALLAALTKQSAPSQDKAIEWLTTDIAQRIEAIQLGRNPTEIANLVAYTGLSEADLLRPANLEGHWFISINFRGCNRTDIIQSAAWTCCHIKEHVEKNFGEAVSDGTIKMWLDGYWYRVEISSHSRREVMRIDFVRCQPDSKGLRWAPRSWRDEYFIEEALRDWALYTFNFVSAFDEGVRPSNVDQLRFVVTEHEGSYIQTIGTEIVTGHLDEIPHRTKEAFEREGGSHSLVISWLLADLRERITPRLATYPANCWRLSGEECIDIHLEPPISNRQAMRGIRYRIYLSEELPSGELKRAPWRRRDVESAKEKVKSWLTLEQG